MSEIETLAKGLTEAQKRKLRFGHWPSLVCENRESPVKSAMARKGLATFAHRIAGKGDFTLTPLGLQVRDYLERNP